VGFAGAAGCAGGRLRVVFKNSDGIESPMYVGLPVVKCFCGFSVIGHALLLAVAGILAARGLRGRGRSRAGGRRPCGEGCG
jgi:hypothetical protein